MKDTLVIMGSHPRSRDKFDRTRTDCDIWVFNEAVSNGTFPEATLCFQMHLPAIWRNPNNRNDPGHFKWLNTQTAIPVYMMDINPDVPRSLKYPIDEILKMVGGDPNHFLTSTVPQAMALAAYLKQYKRVEIYGVAMETNTEYQFQREGVAYWYGFLKGMGIDVYFADETFRALLYGYEGEVVLPYETFTDRIAELEPLVAKHNSEYNAAAIVLQKIIDELVDRDNTAEISEAVAAQAKLSQVLGNIDGARQENLKYKEKADVMREASGGEFIFSRQEFESAAKNLSDRANEWMVKVNVISGQGDLIHRSIVMAAKGSPKRKKLLASYKDLLLGYLQAHNQAMIYAGASAENFRYMSRLDKSVRAAGGVKSEQAIIEQMQAQNV